MTSGKMTWDEAVAALTAEKKESARLKTLFEEHTGAVSDWLLEMIAALGLPIDTSPKDVLPSLRALLQPQEWTIQDGVVFQGIEFDTFKSKDGKWGYFYSNDESLVTGFDTEQAAHEHAAAYAYETVSDRAADVDGL